jgi:SHS2 domain-containing protein
MKKFEILPKGEAAARIRVTASTRAGILTAAVQGMFAAALPDVDPDSDEKDERPFSVMADDANGLLAALLAEALAVSVKHGESFDDIRFTLATDKKAEGAFIGKTCSKYGAPITGVSGAVSMEKDEEGEWVSEIAFR